MLVSQLQPVNHHRKPINDSTVAVDFVAGFDLLADGLQGFGIFLLHARRACARAASALMTPVTFRAGRRASPGGR